jgi:hypothetical protein
MAVIERGYSEQGLPQPKAAELNPQAASTQGRMFVELGDAGSAIAQQLEKAHLTAEESKARNIYETAHAEVLSRAAQEVDLTPEKQKAYHEELRTALDKAANSISIQNYQDLFKEKYSPKADVAEAKLNSIFLKRYRDQARGEFQKSKSIQGANYATTSSMPEKSMYVQELYHDIDNQISSGYMTKEEGEKEKIRTIHEWDKNHMKNDLETRPQWLLEEAKKGEKGFYAGVNPGFRANMQAQAEKRIHAIEIINRNSTENEMMKKQISGALTPDEVEESFLNKTISRSFYEKMNKLIDSPVGPTGNTDPASFYYLTDSLTRPNTTPSMARENLIEAYSEGKLSQEDFKKLYSLHIMPTDQGPESLQNLIGPKAQGDFATIKAIHDKQQQEFNDRKNIFKSVYKIITNYLGHKVDPSPKKPFGRQPLPSGFLEKHKINVPEEGTEISDDKGNKIRVYSDKTYDEVGGK